MNGATESYAARRPLASAALALLGSGCTATELAERLHEEAATFTAERARELLGELAALGLVRITTGHERPRFTLTSLGEKTLAAGVGGGGLETELAELERLRSDLLSTVSHELRTPLTAVRTCVGLLLDPETEPDEAQVQQLLQTIERNADRMQRLVADVLDLARYRTGNVQLQLRRFDAGDLARDVAEAVLPLAQAHRQRLAVRVGGGDATLFGDHRRLEQALLNLVSNAQKFSPDGATIDVEVTTDGEEVCWQVADRGPGIPPEDQVRLFERFFVGRSDVSGPGSGVGLGLPTALAIAQAHGGRIEVDSAPGHGSTFRLCVPVAGPDEVEP